MAAGRAIGSRRQAILLGALAVVLLLAVVRWRPGGGEAPAPSARRSAGAAGRAADASGAEEPGAATRSRLPAAREISPDEVPILSAGDFAAPAARGSADPGRDLFDLREPTRRPPPTPTPAPPVPGDARFIGPLPPPPPTPTPAPPEITFKFMGSFGLKEHPIAVIQQGNQVLNVRSGDTLFGKFVLRKVGYESIDVGFVGFPESETRRLGITP